MKRLSFVLPFLFIVTGIIGCSDTENPLDPRDLTENTETGVFAEAKHIEVIPAAPAAPSAPADGTPFVKEVGFYRDWKRTKPLTGTVQKGSTIYIKIVFSEGMKLVVADDKDARPILYHKVGKKLRRFKVVGFTAKGKDFGSGDAKPVGNQATYYAKYVVKEADLNNVFTIAVGKFSIDRQGNPMRAFYTHDETLQCGPLPPQQETPEVPEEETAEQPTDTVPPTVQSITHLVKGNPVEGPIPAGTTVETRIVFSERVIPAITYTTGEKTQAYRVSQSTSGAHWRGICKPMDETGTVWLCRKSVAQPSFAITVTTNTTDAAGNRLAEEVTTAAIPVTERPPRLPREPAEEPDQTPADPTDVPETEPQEPTDPKERAIAVARRMYDRDQEIGALFYAGSITLNEYDHRLDQILVEESGFLYYDRDFIGDLTLIYNQENPQDTGIILLGNFSFRGITVEWMRLHFTHPNKTKGELLALFQQSCKDGRVSIAYNQFW